MKIKNNEFVKRWMPAFNVLNNMSLDNKKIRYAAMKTAPHVEAESVIYNKLRIETLEKRASKDKEGNAIKEKVKQLQFDPSRGADVMVEVEKYVFSSPETEALAIKEVNRLGEQEIELIVHGVELSEFDDIKIETNLLIALGDFIKFEEKSEMKAV